MYNHQEQFQRFSSLIGEDAFRSITEKHVMIFGIGGVGSYLAESLARCGIGKITLIDFDTISVHNVNRQIHSLISTVGLNKTEVMKKRIADINPLCVVKTFAEKAVPGRVADYFENIPDFVADAIDDVPAKVALIQYCRGKSIPIISAMGTGNKLHPEMLEIADISKTEVCPLCRSVRKKLKDSGIVKDVPVVFSKEIPIKQIKKQDEGNTPASCSFVPSSAGLLMTSYIVNTMLNSMKEE